MTNHAELRSLSKAFKEVLQGALRWDAGYQDNDVWVTVTDHPEINSVKVRMKLERQSVTVIKSHMFDVVELSNYQLGGAECAYDKMVGMAKALHAAVVAVAGPRGSVPEVRS